MESVASISNSIRLVVVLEVSLSQQREATFVRSLSGREALKSVRDKRDAARLGRGIDLARRVKRRSWRRRVRKVSRRSRASGTLNSRIVGERVTVIASCAA